MKTETQMNTFLGEMEKSKNKLVNQEEDKPHDVFDEKYNPNTGLEVVKEESIQMVRLSADDIDVLDQFEESALELSSEYWTPKLPGEQRRVIFQSITTRLAPDINDKSKLVPLKCANFLVKDESGSAQQISNASKRLVGTLESFNLPQGTPLQITYEGRKKNNTNGFHSDTWSIVPLIPKQK